MKKRVDDLTPGTPFKHKGQVFIVDKSNHIIRLTDGEIFYLFDYFENHGDNLVTVCKRIKKSDVKERK